MSKHYTTKIAFLLYLLVIVTAVVYLLFAFLNKPIIQTDLTTLLPQEKNISVAEIKAQAKINQQLNQNLVALIGATDKDVAVKGAKELALLWQESQIFQQVNLTAIDDLETLQQQVKQLSIALLPKEIIKQIQSEPQQYFDNRAKEIVNPFSSQNIFPLEQDLLAFSASSLSKLSQDSNVQLDLQSNMLYLEDKEMVWLLINARLPEQSMMNVSNQLLPLLAKSELLAQQNQLQTLFAGGAIFSAEGKQTGETESKYMSLMGISLTLLFLLLVFKGVRAFSLFTVPLVGIVLGLSVTILIFAEIHILTLVIGTSLVGLLIDFPLHWFAKGIKAHSKDEQSIGPVAKAFSISLGITITGYLLLLFTPLPILKQTAVFSSVSLIAAYLFTLLILPVLIGQQLPTIRSGFVRFCHGVQSVTWAIKRLFFTIPVMIIIVIVLGVAVWQSNWQDDIRQWVQLPDKWLQQSIKIAQLTATEPSSQYLLLTADNQDNLLKLDQTLSEQLGQLKQQNILNHYLSLSQLINSTEVQHDFKQTLATLDKSSWQGLSAIGIPDEMLEEYLQQIIAQPVVTIDQVLNNPLTEQWASLWLGKVDNQSYATMITLSGVSDEQALIALVQNNPNVDFINQRAHLNDLFIDTRNQAIYLKLLSFILALLLLMTFLGLKKGLFILGVPIMAVISTVALFSILGLPISLFSIFGLLLVSAIGVDYAICASVLKLDTDERLAGIVLALVTTLISFSILAFSSTPAVANFGLSVSLGVSLNLLFSTWLIKPIIRSRK